MQGKTLLADRRILSLDEDALIRSAAVQGARLFESLGVKNHG
jgi:hypothetical protein